MFVNHGKKFNFIYLTESIFNGKYYIGRHSTNDLNDGYYGSGKRLNQDIENYGLSQYVRHILEYCDDLESLIKRESEILTPEVINNWYCLNMVEGGSGKKNKYYVKGFTQSEYDNHVFVSLTKDGVTRDVISYLIPYHKELGWVESTQAEIEQHRLDEKIRRENSDFCVVSKRANGFVQENDILAEHLSWYLERKWKLVSDVQKTKEIKTYNQIRFDISSRLMSENIQGKELIKRINSELKKLGLTDPTKRKK